MELHKKLGLKEDLLQQIKNTISNNSKIKKAVIFGSRARGSFRKNSDIDIAVWSDALSPSELNMLKFQLESLNTALTFDLLHFEKLCKAELKKNIEGEGITIYAKAKS